LLVALASLGSWHALGMANEDTVTCAASAIAGSGAPCSVAGAVPSTAGASSSAGRSTQAMRTADVRDAVVDRSPQRAREPDHRSAARPRGRRRAPSHGQPPLLRRPGQRNGKIIVSEWFPITVPPP